MKRCGRLLFVLLAAIVLLASLTLLAAASNNSGELIEEVRIVFDEPEVGKPLDFTVDCSGSTAYYKVNKVQWYDVTTSAYVNSLDKVKAGHQYEIRVEIASAVERYYFWRNTLTGASITKYSINGSPECYVSGNGKPNSYTYSGATIGWYYHAKEKVDGIDVMVLEEPLAGETPSFAYVSNHSWHTIQQFCWKDLTTGEVIDFSYMDQHPDYTFVAGHTYAASFWVFPGTWYVFKNPEEPAYAMVNKSRDVTCTPCQTEDGKTDGFLVTKNFGTCPAVVEEVSLTVTAPVEGTWIPRTVSIPSGAKYGDADVRWYKIDTSGNRDEIAGQETFAAGCTYELEVDVYSHTGHEFPLKSTNTSVVPDVWAYVNGKQAQIVKIYDENPSERFTVRYSFGECGDTVIDLVTIVDVVEPVAGERPSYQAIAVGQGYRVEPVNSTQYGCFVNGISWSDVTENGRTMTPNELFVAGHQYNVSICLEATDDYTFWFDEKMACGLFDATVNGQDAEVSTYEPDGKYKQTIFYTFTCQAKEVSTVMLYDLDAPEAGKTPDTQVTAAYPEVYTVNRVRWLGAEGLPLSGGAVFAAGEAYRVEIQVAPTRKSVFTENVAVILNGTAIGASEGTSRDFKPDGCHIDGVYFDDTHVWIYYTFRNAAAAPEAPADPVSFQWSGSGCTVTLEERQPSNAQVVAAVYQNGKFVKMEYLIENEARTLAGDRIKVFFLNDTSHAPLREAITKNKSS